MKDDSEGRLGANLGDLLSLFEYYPENLPTLLTRYETDSSAQ